MIHPPRVMAAERLRNVLLQRCLPIVLVIPLVTDISIAWVYPEHRQIALIGIEKLDTARHLQLDQLWRQARTGHESRLSRQVADTGQRGKPTSIDYAAWPAIAGDHSCSAQNMLQSILTTEWILEVADITAHLRDRLATTQRRDQIINYLRDSDIELQRADPEYATRAGSNNVHFLLARPSIDTPAREYFLSCLRPGSELSAIGAYAWYHWSALLKASGLTDSSLSPNERSAITIAALADEAFAIHFLEDAFAAGHVAGTWGDASLRKGTHDYYNEHGLAATTWDGSSAILLGDAWMQRADADRAAEAVRLTLEQFLSAASGVGPAAGLKSVESPLSSPDTLNVCSLDTLPGRPTDPAYGNLLAEVLKPTPIPGLAAGKGELPRFRAELGPFVGVAPAVFVHAADGGFGPNQKMVNGTGGIEIAVRLGLGLEGVMNESGDGLVFLDLTIRQDAASTAQWGQSPELAKVGTYAAAIPSRSALGTRLRLPFYLIPGDLILAAPFLIFTSPSTFAAMAVVAGNGGLIPWQAGIATSIGRFQVMLGREVGITFFGYTRQEDPVVIPGPGANPANAVLVSMRSIQFEFPFVEYRPFRTFSTEQSSSLVLQFYGGFDVPTRVSVVAPVGVPDPELRTIWQIGLRFAFDWRYYF